MDLAPKHYLLIYALIVTPIVVSFFFIRRRSPTRLNLGPTKSRTPVRSDSTHAQPVAPGHESRENGPRRAQTPPRGNASAASQNFSTFEEKALNVFFQWNGHTWDAYEVLGIPAGSSSEAAMHAYTRLLTHGDPDSVPFFKAAFEAIAKSEAWRT